MNQGVSMNTDITTYLISKGITDSTSLTAVSKQLAAKGLSGSDSSSLAETGFKTLLDAETAKIAATETAKLTSQETTASTASVETAASGLTDLGEMRQLISALDKSILGNVAESLDEEEVAADLLADPASGTKVIDQLVGGHFNSIVMTSSDVSEDTEDSLKSEVSDSLTDTSTETLAENLETLMEHLNQIGN